METRSSRRKKKEEKELFEGKKAKIDGIFTSLIDSRNVETFSCDLQNYLTESIKVIKKRRRPDQIDFNHFSISLSTLRAGIEYILKNILLKKQYVLANSDQEAQFLLQDLFKFEEEATDEIVNKISSFFLERVMTASERRLSDIMLDWIFENLRKRRYEYGNSGVQQRKRRKINSMGWHKQSDSRKEETILYLKVIISICKPKGSDYQVYLKNLVLEEEDTKMVEEVVTKKSESLSFLPHSNIDDSEPFLHILRKIYKFQFGWLLRQISQYYPNLFAAHCLSSLMNKIGTAHLNMCGGGGGENHDNNSAGSPMSPTGSSVFDQSFFASLGVTSEIIILRCLIKNSPNEIIAQISSVLKTYSDLCESKNATEYQSILVFIFCFTILFRCEGVVTLFHDFVKNIIENKDNPPPLITTIRSHVFSFVDVNSLIREVVNLRINEFTTHPQQNPILFLESLDLSTRYSIIEHIQTELMRLKVEHEMTFIQNDDDNSSSFSEKNKNKNNNSNGICEFLEKIVKDRRSLELVMKNFFQPKSSSPKERLFWFYLIECLGISKGQHFASHLLTTWINIQGRRRVQNNKHKMVDEDDVEEEKKKSNVDFFDDLFRSFCDLYVQFSDQFFSDLMNEITKGIEKIKKKKNNDNIPKEEEEDNCMIYDVRFILHHLNDWTAFVQKQQQKQHMKMGLHNNNDHQSTFSSLFSFCFENWGYIYGMKFVLLCDDDDQKNNKIFATINQLYLNLLSFKKRQQQQQIHIDDVSETLVVRNLPQSLRNYIESISNFLVIHFHFLLTPFPKINELDFPNWSTDFYEEGSLMARKAHEEEINYFSRLSSSSCLEETSLEEERASIISILRICIDLLLFQEQQRGDNNKFNLSVLLDGWFQLIFSRIVCNRIHPNGVEGLCEQVSNTIFPFHLHHNFLSVFQSLLPNCFKFVFFKQQQREEEEEEMIMDITKHPTDGIQKGSNHQLFLESLFLGSSSQTNETKLRRIEDDDDFPKTRREKVVLNVHTRKFLSKEEIETNEHIRMKNEEWIMTLLRGILLSTSMTGDDEERKKFIRFSQCFSRYLELIQKNEIPPDLEDYKEVMSRKTIQFNFDISVCSFFSKYPFLHDTLFLIAQKHRKEFSRYFHVLASLMFDTITKWDLLRFFSDNDIVVDRSDLREKERKKRDEVFMFTEKNLRIIIEAQWVPVDNKIEPFLIHTMKKFSSNEVLDVLKKYFDLMFLFCPNEAMFWFNEERGEYHRRFNDNKEVVTMSHNDVLDFNALLRRIIQKHLMEYDKTILPFLF